MLERVFFFNAKNENWPKYPGHLTLARYGAKSSLNYYVLKDLPAKGCTYMYTCTAGAVMYYNSTTMARAQEAYYR